MNQVIPFPVKKPAPTLSPSEYAAGHFALNARHRAYRAAMDLDNCAMDCMAGVAAELDRDTLKSLVDASRLTILAMGALNRDRALAEALCKWMNEEEARSNER